MSINLHHLELFYYVAEAGGISKAIQIMPYPIQQPAVSQQMIKLEENLDVKLFDRRPFELTAAGKVLLATVAPFMEKIVTLEDDLRHISSRRLRIGCASIISEYYLMEVLSIVKSEFDDFSPVIKDIDSENAYTFLLNRELDVSICTDPPPRSSNFNYETLLELPYVIICPKDKVKDFSWQEHELSQVNWITLQSESKGVNSLREMLREYTLSPNVAAQTNSLITALKYVSAGLGVGFMLQPPKFLLDRYELSIIEVPRPIFSPINIAWRSELDQNPLCQSFIKAVHQLLEKAKKDFT